MKERGGSGKSPNQEPTNQRKTSPKEQLPHGGGINKQEIHAPKEIPLALEPKLPGHDQQTGGLDPKVEDAIRRYAMGDPEEEARLREQAKNDPRLRHALLHPGGGLAYGPHPPGD